MGSKFSIRGPPHTTKVHWCLEVIQCRRGLQEMARKICLCVYLFSIIYKVTLYYSSFFELLHKALNTQSLISLFPVWSFCNSSRYARAVRVILSIIQKIFKYKKNSLNLRLYTYVQISILYVFSLFEHHFHNFFINTYLCRIHISE